MPVREETRKKYRELLDEALKLEALAGPEMVRLNDKIWPLEQEIERIQDEINRLEEPPSKLREKAYALKLRYEIESCYDCGVLIFKGDKSTTGQFGRFRCEGCSPRLSEAASFYRKALSVFGDSWDHYGFSSRESMQEELSKIERLLEEKGDISAADRNGRRVIGGKRND